MKALHNPVFLHRNFNRFVLQFRNAAMAYSTVVQSNVRIVNPLKRNHLSQDWPNTTLGPVNAINPNYPLPGFVGIVHPKSVPIEEKIPDDAKTVYFAMPDVREGQYSSILMHTQRNYEDENPSISIFPSLTDSMECSIHCCPYLLRRDLEPLFPDRKLSKMVLTIIAMSHKTENSMSSWKESTINERESLAHEFIAAAIDICSVLKELGYWADFINPFTGTPYLNKHFAAAPLMETDSRMEHFGFVVDELGCCKVLRHKRFGHNSFTGLILSDAPRDHPLLTHMLQPPAPSQSASPVDETALATTALSPSVTSSVKPPVAVVMTDTSDNSTKIDLLDGVLVPGTNNR